MNYRDIEKMRLKAPTPMIALVGAILFGLFVLWFGVTVVLDNGALVLTGIWPYLWILVAVLILGIAIDLAVKEFRRRHARKHR